MSNQSSDRLRVIDGAFSDARQKPGDALDMLWGAGPLAGAGRCSTGEWPEICLEFTMGVGNIIKFTLELVVWGYRISGQTQINGCSWNQVTAPKGHAWPLYGARSSPPPKFMRSCTVGGALRHPSTESYAPLSVGFTDISAIKTQQGKLYLCIVLDLYDQRTVGWSMQDRQDRRMVLRAVQMAVWQRQGSHDVILHSDRGSQFPSGDYYGYLAAKEGRSTPSKMCVSTR